MKYYSIVAGIYFKQAIRQGKYCSVSICVCQWLFSAIKQATTAEAQNLLVV
jgi:hypothetical protein